MLWSGKRAHDITAEDIRQLVASKQAELQTIEYKGEMPGTSSGEKREFLADVSSFANARGGHIFYGIPSDDDDLPMEPIGLEDRSVNDDKLRLENMLADGIRPKIPGLGIHPVEMDDGRVVYAIHIPRSFARPHQVVFNKDHRFYSRTSAGKYRVDVDELRSLFAYSTELGERIRLFRQNRLGMILAEDTPVQLQHHPKTILHVVPLSAFDTESQLDPAAFRGQYDNRPIWGHPQVWRFNLDGYLTSSEPDQQGMARDYFQGFRSGVIEAVDAHALDSGQVPTLYVEVGLIAAVFRYLRLLREVEVQPPIVITLSFWGVEGQTLAVSQRLRSSLFGILSDSHAFDRDMITLPDVLLDEFPYEVADMANALRPIFDALWNAAGWERCFDYDDDGNFEYLAEIRRDLSIP